MKRLLTLLLLALTITASAQIKLGSYVVTIGENDTYPVTLDSLQQGGLQVTYNRVTRDAIPMARRKEGMYVSYSSADSLFKLVGGKWVYQGSTTGYKRTYTADNNDYQAILENPDSTAFSYGYNNYDSVKNYKGFIQIRMPMAQHMWAIEGTINQWHLDGKSDITKFKITGYAWGGYDNTIANWVSLNPQFETTGDRSFFSNLKITGGNVVYKDTNYVALTIGDTSTAWGSHFTFNIDKVYLNDISNNERHRHNWRAQLIITPGCCPPPASAKEPQTTTTTFTPSSNPAVVNVSFKNINSGTGTPASGSTEPISSGWAYNMLNSLGSASYLNADVNASANSVVQRDSGGNINGVYLKMSGPVIDAIGINDIVTTANDGYLRRSSASAVRTFLGMPSGGETLQSVTDRGASTTKGITSKQLGFNSSGSNIGFLGKGSDITTGMASYPDVLSIIYAARDFAIGGWRKSDGLWNGISMYINSDTNYVGIGTASPAYKLDVNGTTQATQFKVSALNTAPSSASDTGTVGEIRITANYIYVCTAANTWVRAALSSW